MKNEIFRKKSLDRVNSPEALEDYIQVTNPGVWLVMGAIIALLIGACVWGFFGRMESTVSASAISDHGTVICTVSGEKNTSIAVGMTVHINNTNGMVDAVSMDSESGMFHISIAADVPDGVYPVEIVTESIRPMDLIFN